MIEIKNVVKEFDGFRALDDLSMTVPSGSVYGLVGPNGAGKSTIIRHLTGIYRQDSGEVLVDGQPVFENPSVKNRIAYIPDDIFFFSNASIGEMARFYRSIYPQFDAERFKKLGEVFGLDTKRQMRKLSKGMQKQAAFWMMMALRPEFLVLDEPINGLDPAGIKEIRDVILTLNQKKGVTFLVSSHLLDELSKIVTTYGIINDGVLIEQITAQELEVRCRHHLKLRVNNIPKATALLSCIVKPEAIKVRDDCICMYDKLDQSDRINRLLVRHGIRVSELSVQTSSLEEYFLERMGK